MSLDGDKVISDYKKKLESELKLNTDLFITKMDEYLKKDETKKTYLSEPSTDILFSGINNSGLKLIGIKDKTEYSQHFLEVNYPEIYNEQNRVPTKGGRKTKSKKSNRRNTTEEIPGNIENQENQENQESRFSKGSQTPENILCVRLHKIFFDWNFIIFFRQIKFSNSRT
jgi:hypothetical protein